MNKKLYNKLEDFTLDAARYRGYVNEEEIELVMEIIEAVEDFPMIHSILSMVVNMLVVAETDADFDRIERIIENATILAEEGLGGLDPQEA